MTDSIEQLRRDAKTLRKEYAAGDASARARIRAHPPRPDGGDLKHADFLHVIAQEQNFSSWPQLKFAVESQGMDRSQKQQRLKLAVFHGQNWVVDRLMGEAPDLADGLFGLQVALYQLDAVKLALRQDPGLATRAAGPRRPIVHLAFSKMIQHWPDKGADMLEIAELLVQAGADVNDGYPSHPGSDHMLSALYGAIGHADNMALGRWLLEHGADPNDGESLYHATELGHLGGVGLLLKHGANPNGTNALLRALDFNNHDMVRMLIAAGARVDDFNAEHVGGEAPWVQPALHQAARRKNDAVMIDLLVQAGADLRAVFHGVSVYSAAHVYGNRALIQCLRDNNIQQELSAEESLLAQAASGGPVEGYLNPAKIPHIYQNLMRDIMHLPDVDDHLRALVAIGVEWDRPDDQGLTPVQISGWEGLPDRMRYILSLGPDMTHVNNYGGTLLSTIIHGSENCPERAQRDHIGCVALALEHGVALPRSAIRFAGDPDMASFLTEWAQAYPGQVVDHDPV